jgi:hypothetical protein
MKKLSSGIRGSYRKGGFLWDTNGKIRPTRHPNIFKTLLKTKGSVNLHIKMFAEDRASGLMTLIELRGLCIKWGAPHWLREAVERQKVKWWKF